MATEKENIKSKRELLEAYEEAAFELAFYAKEEKNVRQGLKEIASTASEAETFYQATHQNTLQLIDREFKKKSRKKATRKILPQALKTAAVIIGIFCTSLTVAVAAVPQVRAAVFKMLYTFEPDRMNVEMVETTAEVDIPVGWEGNYFPTYIPKGYVFELQESDPFDHVVFYFDGDKKFRYSEHHFNTFAVYDSEDAIVSEVTVQGQPGKMLEKNGTTTIIWQGEDHYYDIFISEDKEEALKIAQSIQKIIKIE